MKKINFFITKTNKFYFKNSWILISFFAISYFLLTILFDMMCVSGSKTINDIIKVSFLNINISLEGASLHCSIHQVSYVIIYFVLNSPMIILFLIFSLIQINKIILKEIHEGSIYTWLTMPTSRNKILLGKIYSIFLMNLVIFFPGFLFTVILTFIYGTGDDWLRIIINYLEFISFVFFAISIFIFISIMISDSTFLANFICSLIITWIFTSFIMTFTYVALFDENSELSGFLKFCKYVKYFSPQSLIVSTLNFSSEIGKIDFDAPARSAHEIGHYTLKYAIKGNIKWGLVIPLTLLTSFSTIIFTYLNVRIFKVKDLHL